MNKKLFTMADYTDTSIVLARPSASVKKLEATVLEKSSISATKKLEAMVLAESSAPVKKLEVEIVGNEIEQKKENLPKKKTKHKTWISSLKNRIFHPAETKQENNVALVRHVSCMFVMDLSESMNYPKENPNIESLNHALQEFKKNMTEACQKCHVQMDVGMVTFHGAEAKLITPFTPMAEWLPKHLAASGVSPMGKGLQLAFDNMLESRNQWEKEKRYIEESWIILFTDGRPTDSIKTVADQIKEESNRIPKRFNFWIVASGDADRKICSYLSEQVIYMKNNQYEETFTTLRKLLFDSLRNNGRSPETK